MNIPIITINIIGFIPKIYIRKMGWNNKEILLKINM
jgi:hypothetical protein